MIQRLTRIWSELYVYRDGRAKKTIHMNRSYYGLHICPMTWRELDNFSSGAVCMVLASAYYDERDYYREYADFLEDIRKCIK